MTASREEQLQARIDEAHQAWLAYQGATAHLERLGRYKRMNKAMRDDLARYQREAREANATLSRVLGRQP